MTTQNTLRFTKMHGIGNDFMVINTLGQPIRHAALPITQLADRHTGVGFDQLLLIEPGKKSDFFCRILNADGSEAEQCGNGLRCVARFIHESGMHTSSVLTLETMAGVFPVEIRDYDHIRVTMGAPKIEHALTSIQLSQTYHLPISVISTGNPHAVTRVTSIDSIQPAELGPAVSANTLFPHGANVGFMEVASRDHIRLRTFERGAGETLACGSNACAAAAAGIINNWVNKQVRVEFRHGSLLIEWEGDSHPLHMTGSAARVYEGECWV